MLNCLQHRKLISTTTMSALLSYLWTPKAKVIYIYIYIYYYIIICIISALKLAYTNDFLGELNWPQRPPSEGEDCWQCSDHWARRMYENHLPLFSHLIHLHSHLTSSLLTSHHSLTHIYHQQCKPCSSPSVFLRRKVHILNSHHYPALLSPFLLPLPSSLIPSLKLMQELEGSSCLVVRARKAPSKRYIECVRVDESE